jgi:hypothetical protein
MPRFYFKAGWSWGCVSAVDSCGRTIFAPIEIQGRAREVVSRAIVGPAKMAINPRTIRLFAADPWFGHNQQRPFANQQYGLE